MDSPPKDDLIDGRLLLWAGFALILFGIVTLIRQCYGWLADGYWPDFTIDAYYAYAERTYETSWIGLNRVLHWFGRRDIWWLSCILGSFVATWGDANITDAKKRIKAQSANVPKN